MYNDAPQDLPPDITFRGHHIMLKKLHELNWENLEMYRQIICLIFLPKINSLMDIDIDNCVHRGNSRTRGSQQIFTSYSIFFNLFSPKRVREWKAPYHSDVN